MKKTIIGILTLLISLNLTAQELPYSTANNSVISLTLNQGVITIKNLTNHSLTLLMYNTSEDTVRLNKHQSKIVNKITGKTYVGAKDIYGCNCWLQLVTDCNLLPIKVSNVTFLAVGWKQLKVEFDAYNTTPGENNSFFVMYRDENSLLWDYYKIDVPEVTGLSQHFIKIVNVN